MFVFNIIYILVLLYNNIWLFQLLLIYVRRSHNQNHLGSLLFVSKMSFSECRYRQFSFMLYFELQWVYWSKCLSKADFSHTCQAIQTQAEMDTICKKLEVCLEEKEKLQRWLLFCLFLPVVLCLSPLSFLINWSCIAKRRLLLLPSATFLSLFVIYLSIIIFQASGWFGSKTWTREIPTSLERRKPSNGTSIIFKRWTCHQH